MLLRTNFIYKYIKGFYFNLLFLIKIDIYGRCMYDLLDEEDKEC